MEGYAPDMSVWRDPETPPRGYGMFLYHVV